MKYVVKRWLIWLLPYLPILVVLTFMSTAQTGCIWLAVPGLAYEGYKYEHQQADAGSAPKPNPKSSDSRALSQDSASYDNSIE